MTLARELSLAASPRQPYVANIGAMRRQRQREQHEPARFGKRPRGEPFASPSHGGPPFLPAPPAGVGAAGAVASCVRIDASQASASIASVMWRCQAGQLRTSSWSRPTSSFASSNSCSITKRADATRASVQSDASSGAFDRYHATSLGADTARRASNQTSSAGTATPSARPPPTRDAAFAHRAPAWYESARGEARAPPRGVGDRPPTTAAGRARGRAGYAPGDSCRRGARRTRAPRRGEAPSPGRFASGRSSSGTRPRPRAIRRAASGAQ